MALEVPLALNLQRRAEAEAVALAQAQALPIASDIGSDVRGSGRIDAADAQQRVEQYAIGGAVEGRIIVVDAEGLLLADSWVATNPTEAGTIGERYATRGRPEVGDAIRDGVPRYDIRPSETLGQDILATAVPIIAREEVVGAVRITQGLQPVRANVRQTILGLAAIGVAGLVAGLILAAVLARSFSRPLSKLAATAHRLGRGDLSSRAGEIRGPREVEDVAGAFDDMAARLEDTVRAQREFVANASHQLRTPLTGMKLRLEAALDDEECADGVRTQLEAADREVDRLAGIVERLLVLARRVERGGEHVVDVRQAAERAAERFSGPAGDQQIRVDGVGGLAVADQGDVDQVLDALIDNALSHGSPPVVLESSEADGQVTLAVRDHGPGIPVDELGRVTERFYRGRGSAPGGSGLGLAIVGEIADRWKGSVTVERAEGGGTRVRVVLPSAEA